MEEPAVNKQIQQSATSTPPEPKRHSFLTNKLFLITIAILILFTIIYAGIYLYLGSQLDKISKPSPTPLPAETSVKEGNPTANWKTYTNSKYGFSFSYPNYFNAKVSNDIQSQFALDLKGKNEEYRFDVEPGDSHEFATSTGVNKINGFSWKVIPTGYYCDAGDCGNTAPSYKYFKQEPCNQQNDPYNYHAQFPNYRCGFSYQLLLFKPLESTVKIILSTFKFTPASPAGGDQKDQVVCTQEAKLCPDGKTYVGREGPNCGFVKCP